MKQLKDISQLLLGQRVKVETGKDVTVGMWYGYDERSVWLLIGNDRISIDWDMINILEVWNVKQGQND